jgi:hypothetical protein
VLIICSSHAAHKTLLPRKEDEIMKKTSIKVLLVTALLVFALEPNVLAQNPTPTQTAPAAPEFLALTVVSVKPEMVPEFQNFMKSTTNPALKKGGQKWREVWQSTTAAGDAFEYILVSPMASFSEFDGPPAIEKGLGAQGFAGWQTKAGSLVNSVRRYIIRTRPDLSYRATRTGPPKMAVVTTVHVGINRNMDLENFIKNDYMPVMKQAQVTYLVSQTIFGGDANEYITLTLRESFAELDKGPVLVQTLGQEAADKLMQRVPSGAVTRLERSISRFVPELSFGQ